VITPSSLALLAQFHPLPTYAFSLLVFAHVCSLPISPALSSALPRHFSSTTSSSTPFPVSPSDPDSEFKCGYNSPDTLFDDNQVHNAADPNAEDQADPTNRAFTYLVQGGAAFCYASVARATVMKFVAFLSASADVLALASMEVDISNIQEGMASTVKWRGKPVFIRHRTAKEIDDARKDDNVSLRDQQADADRVKVEKWIVVIGVCTHLGCVPINAAGDWGGWFCPCHGSHYDTSGRIRKGPAPLNLEVPQYKFLTDTKVLLG